MNTVLALSDVNLLWEANTTIAYNPQSVLAKSLSLLPAYVGRPIINEFSRRKWLISCSGQLRQHWFNETIRLTLIKTHLYLYLGISYRELIDWVLNSLDHHVAHHHLKKVDAIYAYEDEAATTFQIAKNRGIICLYDLPSVFYKVRQDIEQTEAEEHPYLIPALQTIQEPDWKLERKEREIALADHIFVASSLGKKFLIEAGIAQSKVSVVPYGALCVYNK